MTVTEVPAAPAAGPPAAGCPRCGAGYPCGCRPPRRRRSRIGVAGAVLVGTFLLVAVLSPYLAPFRVTEIAGDPIAPPGGRNWLGTTRIGYDVASQLLAGTRASVLVALLGGGGTLVLGGLAGMVAGWFGGRVDTVVMRLVDVVLVLPKLPLLIVASAYVGPDIEATAAVIALVFWPNSARVVRMQVLALRHRAHVEAAVGFGAGAVHVLRRHVVPEISLVLVAGFVAAANRAVTFEAGLAFLGLGDPIRASWGAMIRDSVLYPGLFMSKAWTWWFLPPVVCLVLLLLGLSFLGMAVEERLHPRLARHTTAGRRLSGPAPAHAVELVGGATP
ncbi:MAG TPA: ABC transporter permease [Acidimicrobiales bacterium]|nr:ABC transporter permease [Acidimicrobiales bacterium]